MSSYGSMSPSDEGFDRYEPPFYCQPPHHHLGSPMDGGGYWPAANGEGHEFDAQDVYHDTAHYIGRSYGYEELQMSGEGLEGHGGRASCRLPAHLPHPHPYAQAGVAAYLECPLQPPPGALRCGGGERGAGPGGGAPPAFVRVVKRRSTANKKERRRTQSINTAFSELRECIPNVPPDTKLSKMVRKRSQSINTAFSQLRGRIPNVLPDTKLSKIKTLRLATSYISYLLKVLESDGEPAGGFRAELHHAPPRRRPPTGGTGGDTQTNSAEKRGKGRTGWPQHVWALELKSEQSLQA